MYVWMLVIGIAFTAIFTTLYSNSWFWNSIMQRRKRSVDEDTKLLTKDEYKALKDEKKSTGSDRLMWRAL